MPARPGNWPLLGHSSDPVAGDPDQLHDLIAYYAKIAETITHEATILQRIGSGDTTELKGHSADAIRSRSKRPLPIRIYTCGPDQIPTMILLAS